ncbi:MAG: hypothetical protein ABI556_10900 [Gemmatimonadales bacterium]
MRAILLAFIATTSLTAQTPAPATGTLIVNGTKVTVQSSSAVSYPGGTGRFVSVLISDTPANPSTFAEYTRIGAGARLVPGIFEGAWAAMHTEKGFSGFTFTIDSNHRILTNQVLVGGQNGMFSLSPDDLVLEVTSVSPRFIGRIRSKQPVLELGEYKLGLDAAFNVVVTPADK